MTSDEIAELEALSQVRMASISQHARRDYLIYKATNALRQAGVGEWRLSFADLRAANVARCAKWHPGGISDWSLSDWMTATCGELGEAANVVKKLNRCRDGLPGNNKTEDELRSMLGDELADTAIYLDLLAAAAGVDLAASIIAKFNAVSVRNGFPDRLPSPPTHQGG